MELTLFRRTLSAVAFQAGNDHLPIARNGCRQIMQASQATVQEFSDRDPRKVARMAPQTYLILIRDGKLALSVGTALESRLLADGHPGLALIPTVRGSDFGERQLRPPGPGGQPLGLWGTGTMPQVVALYEDGLLTQLESLGLAAYVGVPHTEEWRVIRWGTEATGAMLLPVASARDLVDAIADHTPWHDYARQPSSRVLAPAVIPAVSAEPAVQPVRRGVPAITRRVAVAGVAGPLLFVGIPVTAAAAATAAPQAPPVQAPGSTAPVLAIQTAYFQGAPQASGGQNAGGPAPAGSAATTGGFFNWLSNTFNGAMTQAGQAEIQNAQAQQAAANAAYNYIATTASAAYNYVSAALPYASQEALSFGKNSAYVGAALGTVGGVALGGNQAAVNMATNIGSYGGLAVGLPVGFIYGLATYPGPNAPASTSSSAGSSNVFLQALANGNADGTAAANYTAPVSAGIGFAVGATTGGAAGATLGPVAVPGWLIGGAAGASFGGRVGAGVGYIAGFGYGVGQTLYNYYNSSGNTGTPGNSSSGQTPQITPSAAASITPPSTPTDQSAPAPSTPPGNSGATAPATTPAPAGPSTPAATTAPAAAPPAPTGSSPIGGVTGVGITTPPTVVTPSPPPVITPPAPAPVTGGSSGGLTSSGIGGDTGGIGGSGGFDFTGGFSGGWS